MNKNNGKIKISRTKFYILNFLRCRAGGNPFFHGRDIENLRIPDMRPNAETKKVRFRELCAKYGVAKCVLGKESLYKVTMQGYQIQYLMDRMEVRS